MTIFCGIRRLKGRPILIINRHEHPRSDRPCRGYPGKKDLILLHTCSTYPASYDELNLRVIPMFVNDMGFPLGYSGHETGLIYSIATVALGACVVERHITLDRAMWGSDQAASVEPQGFGHMVQGYPAGGDSLGGRC